MANIKSAKKRILVNRTKADRNKAIKSGVKTAIKKVYTAVEANDKEAATTALLNATSVIDKAELIITHREINDGTVEGLRHKRYKAFSVQFHPDAAPGPHDAVDLFDDFMHMINQRKEEENA